MKQLLLLVACFLSLPALPQLRGLLTDSTGAPLPYVAVGLLNSSDSSLKQGSITDDLGHFEFSNLKSGSYLLKIQAPGFRDYLSETLTHDSTRLTEIPTILLRSSANSLEEITVSAIRRPMEFRNGNITVNVDGTALAIGNSVYDLLTRMPGVTVSNGNIAVQGREGVAFYIDGRLQALNGQQMISLLKGMNASVVDKIEIIRNPSAKYDAAGSAGIIDIKTKKLHITGLSGNAGYTFSQGVASTNMADLALNYKGKKISLFSSINAYEGTLSLRNDIKKTVVFEETSTVLDSRLTELDVAHYATLNLGLDWYADKKNIIGMKAQLVPGTAKRTLSGNSALTQTDSSFSDILYKRTVPNDWFYGIYNLNAEHAFDTLGTKLRFSGDAYLPCRDVYNYDYRYQFTDGNGAQLRPDYQAQAMNELNLNIFSAKTDYEQKLSPTANLEAGLKGSFQKITSNYDFRNRNLQNGDYERDSLFSNQFTYYEKIGAAYVNLLKEIRKISLQLGLRAEQTDVRTESELSDLSFRRQYLRFFPRLSVGYNPSDKHAFSASYNRSIYRPDYNSLNPYPVFKDLYNINRGNPQLLPEIYHRFEISHTFRSRFTNSFGWSISDNPIRGQAQLNDTTKISYFQLGNLKSSNELNYFISYNGDLLKWWNVTLNLAGFYYDFIGTIDNHTMNRAAFSWYGEMNHVFSLPHNFRFELGGWMVGPWLYGGFYTIRPRGAINMGVKKILLKDQLTIAVSLNDVFFSGVEYTDTDFANQHYRQFKTYDSRRLNLSVVYNFGKIKAQRREEKGRNEEKQRLGK